MKAALSEIKKNLQGTNSGGEEAREQINDLVHKEEKSIPWEQQEEKKKLKKMMIVLGTSGTTLNITTSES